MWHIWLNTTPCWNEKSNYIIAINTDKDAPIAEIADILVVADANEVIKELTKLINQ